MKSSAKDICIKERISDELMKFAFDFEQNVINAFGFTNVGHILGYLKISEIPSKYWNYIVSKLDFIKWDEERKETVIRCRYRTKNTSNDEKGGGN